MQCDFQSITNIFHEQDTVEIVEEFFGTFAIFLHHFEVYFMGRRFREFRGFCPFLIYWLGKKIFS